MHAALVRTLFTALLLLMPGSVRAANGHVLIWTGAKTKEEAEQLKVKLEERRATLSQQVFEPAPGFPKVELSSDIKGLNPGFWLVTLGYCPEQPTALLRAIKAVQPGAYTKSVELEQPAASCPKNLLGDSPLRTSKVKLVEGTMEVRVLEQEVDVPARNFGRDIDEEATAGWLFVLRDKKTSDFIDVAILPGNSHIRCKSDIDGPKYCDCVTEEPRNLGAVLVFTRECTADMPPCKMGDSQAASGWKVEYRVNVREGKLDVSRRQWDTDFADCPQHDRSDNDEGD